MYGPGLWGENRWGLGGMRYRGYLSAVLLWTLLFNASAALAVEHFYRIIEGPNPGRAQEAIDRYTYGAEVLYTGDAKAHPTHVDGTVWHSNLGEAKYFVGTHNPVIEQKGILEL